MTIAHWNLNILPQTPDNEPRFISIGGYKAFDDVDKEEYANLGVLRSGNMTWLTYSCNQSLGNKMPDDKAAEYISCLAHSALPLAGSSQRQITQQVGNKLRPLG